MKDDYDIERKDYDKRKSKQDKKAKKEYNVYKSGGKNRTNQAKK